MVTETRWRMLSMEEMEVMERATEEAHEQGGDPKENNLEVSEQGSAYQQNY